MPNQSYDFSSGSISGNIGGFQVTIGAGTGAGSPPAQVLATVPGAASGLTLQQGALYVVTGLLIWALVKHGF